MGLKDVINDLVKENKIDNTPEFKGDVSNVQSLPTVKKSFIDSLYSNGIRKEFQNLTGKITGADGIEADGLEDKTYLGFSISFFDDKSNKVFADQDLNTYPTTLLWDPTDDYSAYKYLKNANQPRRAEYLKLFRENILKIEKDYPWYFQKITGLSELFKIDPKQNFRGKEKSIVIEMLESIDLRITYILDLYRKAAWDAEYMRWMLPENMRQFSMIIRLAEIRDIHTFDSETKDLVDFESFMPVLEFKLSKCEFNVLQEGFPISDIDISNSGEAAKQQFSIKIGKIREINSYNLYKLILDDFEKKTGLNVIASNSQSTDAISVAKNTVDDVKKKRKISLDLDLQQIQGDVREDFTRIAQDNLTKFYLGNVYEDSFIRNTTQTLQRAFDGEDLLSRDTFTKQNLGDIAEDFVRDESTSKVINSLGDVGLTAPSTISRISQNVSFRE